MIQSPLLRESGFEPLNHQKHRLWEKGVSNLIIGTIGLSIVLQLYLVFIRQINWDEFSFLSLIYEYRRGDLTAPVQTFYVHFFGWLPGLAADEIGQIIVARLIMLALHTGTLGLIYYAARRFTSRDAALLGVLSYTACGFVLLHAAAFRADPIATFLLIGGATALLVPRLSWLHTVSTGAAVAIAGLVTIKSIFYVPIIIAVAILRLVEAKDRRSQLLILLIGGAVSVAVFGFLYVLHSGSLAAKEHADILTSASGSAAKVFDKGVFLREWPFFVTALAVSPLTFAAIGSGMALCLWHALEGKTGRIRNLVLLTFAFPLATIFFYRNSFPYYYVFVLAPAAVLSAIAFDRIGSSITKLASVLVLAGSIFVPFTKGLSPGQGIQRATLNAIHSIFPKPVAYIDAYSMVGSFPKIGFFMSTWGIENYRAAGRPTLLNAIVDATPRFVVANSPALEEALVPGSVEVATAYRLFDADSSALRDNYVHHWGAIWVAGKTVDKLDTDHDQSVSILISGTYTVEAQRAISIDGATQVPGDVISLLKGVHVFRSADRVQTVILRWGDHLWRPASAAPRGPIFSGF